MSLHRTDGSPVPVPLRGSRSCLAQRKKSAQTARRNPNCGRRELSVVTLWFVGCFFVKKKHRSNRRCAFGCAQKAPLVLEFGGNNQKQVIWDSRLGSFFYFYFVSTSHPTDPMGTNGIWDEFTYMFMVDFGWVFHVVGKYTGPGKAVPWISYMGFF